jgi:dimethylsulfoniopropionate demethylase
MSNLGQARERRPAILTPSRRVRRTPYSERVETAGVSAYTVYNHMLLPTGFAASVEDDYWHLRSAVQIWDVACERQVELSGPDALRLAQLLTPRDLSRLANGRCGYVPVVDAEGCLLNDPLLIRLADDRLWLSIADADVRLYALGLAVGLGLDVRVSEADVHPLAVQGPFAEEVVAAVLGEEVRRIAFFSHARLPFQGRHMVVSRSGWSVQGGFEIYLDDPALGGALWDAICAAGQRFTIRPGYPHPIERIEGGLLSYGNDVTTADTPLEAGLERYCDGLDSGAACLGADALRARRAAGVERRIAGVALDGPPVTGIGPPWPVATGSVPAGQVTSAAWSPRLKRTVCLAMLAIEACSTGTAVEVATPCGHRQGYVCDLPFPGAVGGRR